MKKPKDDTWLDAAIRAEFQKREQASGSELRTSTEAAIAEIKRSLDAHSKELLKDYEPKPLLERVVEVVSRLSGVVSNTNRATGAKRPTARSNPLKSQRQQRKGDGTLIEGKQSVAFKTAEDYLGISSRQRQKLTKNGSLREEGKGHNRKLLTESLQIYLPPNEKPN